ncbi:hypothetical protein V1522DRAFT_355085, partial [Lipomyces starkeyi]
KVDIERTWDLGAPLGGGGDDFMDSVKSTRIPQRSEPSDSVNRHFWLHNTELRLNQIRIVELNEQPTMDELADEGLATVDMVTGVHKRVHRITPFLLTFEDGYGMDLKTLVDENVDLGDIAESHKKTVAGTIVIAKCIRIGELCLTN